MNPVTASESPPTIETSPSTVPDTNRTTRPRVWTVFATWFAAAIAGQFAVIAGFVAAGVGIGAVLGAQGADAATIQARVQESLQQPLPALLLSLLPCQLGMIAVVLLAARRSKEPFRQRIGFVPPTGRKFSRLSLATMAAFTLSLALASALGITLLFGQTKPNVIGTALQHGSWWSITLLSVFLSIIPALVEETLFRGYIQRRLLQRWSPAVAIGVTTLLFALLHADSLPHIIAVVPLGIITGLLAYRTNSVRPGMFVHAVHNAGAVGFGALVKVASPLVADESLGLLLIGAIVTLGLLGLPAVVSLLRRRRSQQASSLTSVSPTTESLASQPA
jgi:membrane protease YdiL (CAAX protease family)